ncbi:MAG: PIG-L family deacetylase [Thermodesulfobacteriota bacterium]|jgi:LmbE family N-acetylglucosaminyl deacetylase
MITFGQGARLLVLSPHCDDAVFSCGHLLATYPGATVVTVFAGRPPAGTPLTEWDAASGFGPGDDVMGARRAEDRAALTLLGAPPLWLDFCDSQYGSPPSLAELTAALQAAVASTGPQAVFIPLGLFHSDHALVHEAALGLARRRRRLSWFAYEDALYRRIPGLVGERVRRCRARGFGLHKVTVRLRENEELKRQAVCCYRSQLRALTTPGRPGYADALTPERFWRLTPPPLATAA